MWSENQLLCIRITVVVYQPQLLCIRITVVVYQNHCCCVSKSLVSQNHCCCVSESVVSEVVARVPLVLMPIFDTLAVTGGDQEPTGRFFGVATGEGAARFTGDILVRLGGEMSSEDDDPKRFLDVFCRKEGESCH